MEINRGTTHRAVATQIGSNREITFVIFLLLFLLYCWYTLASNPYPDQSIVGILDVFIQAAKSEKTQEIHTCTMKRTAGSYILDTVSASDVTVCVLE